MTAAALSLGWAHPVRAAMPPFTETGPKWALEKMQCWASYVEGSLLDDIAAVLDLYSPTENEIDEHVAGLVAQGRAIRSEEVPSDHRRAVGHVRKMAWTLNELLELLVANQCPTEEP
ncbi:hypothetical protein ACWD3I_25590 [Streptomyces sp. NPDC002817]|uniref:hypothetical protein n=1 Tax=Streptomyces sp. NPDC088357 TaxID=3154655 RepID=UPI0034149B03